MIHSRADKILVHWVGSSGKEKGDTMLYKFTFIPASALRKSRKQDNDTLNSTHDKQANQKKNKKSMFI